VFIYLLFHIYMYLFAFYSRRFNSKVCLHSSTVTVAIAPRIIKLPITQSPRFLTSRNQSLPGSLHVHQKHRDPGYEVVHDVAMLTLLFGQPRDVDQVDANALMVATIRFPLELRICQSILQICHFPENCKCVPSFSK
jgi:hypothetical protein